MAFNELSLSPQSLHFTFPAISAPSDGNVWESLMKCRPDLFDRERAELDCKISTDSKDRDGAEMKKTVVAGGGFICLSQSESQPAWPLITNNFQCKH